MLAALARAVVLALVLVCCATALDEHVTAIAASTVQGVHRPALAIYSRVVELVSRPSTVLVYLHGGGWISGTATVYARAMRNIRAASDLIIVFVDYRLAPKTRFPGALSDVCQALIWVRDNISEYGGDADRIALMGESAGGNLAIAFSILRQQQRQSSGTAATVSSLKDMDLCANAFVYPVTDFSRVADTVRPYVTYESGKGAGVAYYWAAYLEYPHIEGRLSLASPALARTDELQDFAPSLVITAGRDVLVSEGQRFAEMLSRSGVDTTATCYANEQHMFMYYEADAGRTDSPAWKQLFGFLAERCGG